MVPSVANPCSMPIPKLISWPSRRPLLGQGTDSITHFERHEDGLVLRILHWNWIIEDHHHAIAGIALERATVLDNDLADCGVIVSQQSHHVCWIRTFGEAG